MTLRTTSHGDLQNLSLSRLVLDNGAYKSYSVSSSTMGSRFGKESAEETKCIPKLSHPPRRPVRAVRPVSAFNANASFLQINHLQGELVRKRKECEELKKENKHLSSEIHMERIMMRNESELTMRNLRNLNQELQAQVKELKQKLHLSEQKVAAWSKVVEEADTSRGEAEKKRALAEALALESREERDVAVAGKARISEELQKLSKEHTDVQLLLAQSEKNYFEMKLKLERVSGEKQFLLKENKDLEEERNVLRYKLKELSEENASAREQEASWRHRAGAAREQHHQAEQERRRTRAELEERTEECFSWKEKHQTLAEAFRVQEELKSQRQNKACQANIKSYFLCMSESDQRIKILKNQDGSPRNFMEAEPVYITTTEADGGNSERTSGRALLRAAAPRAGRDPEPPQFSELLPAVGDPSHQGAPWRSRKVEYFWIPTDD